jgi:CelD/BcsL family acetyltransferase involved in cellulose biosynthesis
MVGAELAMGTSGGGGSAGAARESVRIEPVQTLDELRDDWMVLAAKTRNIFSTWDWASTWWRHFGDDRRLALAACRSPQGRIVAIVPLYVSTRRRIRVARLLGHGPADQLGPVCDPADRREVARAVRRFVLDDLRCSVFVADQVSALEGWSALPGGTVVAREASPVMVSAHRDWESFLGSRSSHFRKKARYEERRLARGFNVEYRLANRSERLADDLDALFALHYARWPQTNAAFGGRYEAFHRDFAACAFERGWLRLWFLDVDGQDVAAWYGFRFGGVESHYQGGRDPSFDRYSVGSVLLLHSIREALSEGVVEYRFLRGSEPYKYRFASKNATVETVVLSRGVGATAIAAASAIGRVRPLSRLLLGPS